MQDGKKIFIRTTLVEPGFEYNIKKGQLKKGSTISKNTHPVQQVEDLKNRLLHSGKLKDVGNCYVLKKTFSTGLIMAKNLHLGELINTQSEKWDRSGYLAFVDDKTVEEVIFRNITTSDSNLSKASFMDGLCIKEICKVHLDFDCLREHDGDDFSPIEQLFFDELSKRDVISKQSRHGYANKNECDIVDEENGLQIEVVTEFKNRFRKTKTPQKDYDSVGLECIGNVFIQSSEALLNKYYSKTYTNKYRKYLAIYCLGNRSAVIGMAKSMKENLKRRGKVKNNFEGLFIIWDDFVNGDKTYLMYSINKDRQPIIEEIITNVGLIKKDGRVRYSQLDPTDSSTYYFWDTESIFGDINTAIGILPSSEIIKNVERLRIVS